MELFRFFIPFLDPSCLTGPLTKLELEELASVINILRKVFELQCERNRPIENRTVNQEKLESLAKAIKYCEELANQLIKTHPGDSDIVIDQLLERVRKVPKSEELLSELTSRAKSVKKSASL